MRKFLQWSLVAGIAVVLIGTIAMQLLASSTGRARDVSVAVLKEKLARLEAERAAVDPAPPPVPPPASAPAEAGSTEVSVTAIGDDALRARWLALFESMEELGTTCEISKETWRKATRRLLEADIAELREEERSELLRCQGCWSPFKIELIALRDRHEDLGRLFSPDYFWDHYNDFLGFWRCEWELEKLLWLDASLGDYPGTVDTFTSLVYLAKVDTGQTIPFWSVDQPINWLLLKPAIESGAVDEARWGRLAGLLEAHRHQGMFLERLKRRTEATLNGFETWGDSPPRFPFSEAPVSYIRTWAYPRITPALFNHDMDRFSRAMNELLDLARIPYFEAKPALERFCEEYDVESGLDELNLMRSNPGWILVLSVSRGGLEAVARQQASMDLIRIAMLLEGHRRDRGAYPESLDVLADKLGGSVPLNPLMGDSYRYAREGESFRLGYTHEQDPHLVEEFGLDPVTAAYWHDPLGYELEGLGVDTDSNTAGP